MCRRCRGETYRVLVCDDHPRARDMFATLILLDDRRLDIQSICEVGSGEEAVTHALMCKPHLVLMDIGLPGINGFEAARRIKEGQPLVAIVMVTANEELHQRQEAARLGAAGFLTKDRAGTDLVPLLLQVLSTEENTTNVPTDSGSGR